MRRDPQADAEARPAAEDVARLFLREPGWQVHLKTDSVKAFCYATAPGQDYYHRLVDGEIYLRRGDERLCLPCAARRGLLTHEPQRLRDRPASPDLDTREEDYDVLG